MRVARENFQFTRRGGIALTIDRAAVGVADDWFKF